MKKFIGILLAVLCLIVLTALPAFAASEAQGNGWISTITTDKETYLAGEEIRVTVTAENRSGSTAEKAQIKSTLPAGLSLKSGSLDKTVQSVTNSGKMELSFTAIKDAGGGTPGGNSSGSSIPSDSVQYGGHSYKIFDTGLTWHEAKVYSSGRA